MAPRHPPNKIRKRRFLFDDPVLDELADMTRDRHVAEAPRILHSNPVSDNPKNIVAQSKVDISVLPSVGVIHGAHACMDGARRYGPYNWREKDIALRAYISAARRHLMAFLDGEDIDPTSGCHHLGHVIAGCAIALDALELGKVIDDRPPPGAAPKVLLRLAEVLKGAK